jgi:hypothetical protein
LRRGEPANRAFDAVAALMVEVERIQSEGRGPV